MDLRFFSIILSSSVYSSLFPAHWSIFPSYVFIEDNATFSVYYESIRLELLIHGICSIPSHT